MSSHELRRRQAAYLARQQALLDELDVLDRRGDGPGDPAWDAEMARINAALQSLAPEAEALSALLRRDRRRMMSVAWGMLALTIAFAAWVAWRVYAAMGRG